MAAAVVEANDLQVAPVREGQAVVVLEHWLETVLPAAQILAVVAVVRVQQELIMRAVMAAPASSWSATRVHLQEPAEPLLRVPARLPAIRSTPSRTPGPARSIFPD
jgi:hypothetical protein